MAAEKHSDSEFHDVIQRLERAAEMERERLLGEGQDADLEAATRSEMEQIYAGKNSSPFRTGWFGPLMAAAVIAALALWAVLGSGNNGSGADDVLLNSDGRIRVEAPVGDVEEFDVFLWKGTLPAGGFWRLRIWDADAALSAVPLFDEELEESRWKPDPTTEWPQAIRWEIQGFSANRDPLGSDTGSSSRSAY